MIFGPTTGPRVEFNTADLGTALETIVADQGSPVHIESVNFCNKTGSAVTVTLCKTEGASDFYYLDAVSIPANEPYPFKDHAIVLSAGQTLRALAGTPDAIDVSVVGIQSVR